MYLLVFPRVNIAVWYLTWSPDLIWLVSCRCTYSISSLLTVCVRQSLYYLKFWLKAQVSVVSFLNKSQSISLTWKGSTLLRCAIRVLTQILMHWHISPESPGIRFGKNERETRKLFASYDSDGNGTLSLFDWKRAVRCDVQLERRDHSGWSLSHIHCSV